MKEVEISGHSYRIGKMDVLTQYHVSRRLAPLVATVTKVVIDSIDLGAAVEQFKASDFDLAKFIEETLPRVNLEAVGKSLSDLSDNDAEFILFNCLEAVHRRVGDKWAKVKTPGARRLQYEDISILDLYSLEYHVIQENLGSFFAIGSPAQS